MSIRDWVKERLAEQHARSETRERIRNASPELWEALRVDVKAGIEEYRDANHYGKFQFNGGESNVFSASYLADTPNPNTLLRKLVMKFEGEIVTVTYSGSEIKHDPISLTFAMDYKNDQVSFYTEKELSVLEAAIVAIDPFLFPTT